MAGNRRPIKHGWVIVAAVAAALTLFVGWEIQTGTAYHKTGGPSYRMIHPGLFWFEVAFQAGITLLVWWCAYQLWRRTEKN
jgi:hypothetical protein